jgi:hypothetical protein
MYILFRVQERLYDEQFLRNLIKVWFHFHIEWSLHVASFTKRNSSNLVTPNLFDTD